MAILKRTDDFKIVKVVVVPYKQYVFVVLNYPRAGAILMLIQGETPVVVAYKNTFSHRVRLGGRDLDGRS